MRIESIRILPPAGNGNSRGPENIFPPVLTGAVRTAVALLSSAFRDLRIAIKRARAEAELLELSADQLKDLALRRNGRRGWVHAPEAWRQGA